MKRLESHEAPKNQLDLESLEEETGFPDKKPMVFGKDKLIKPQGKHFSRSENLKTEKSNLSPCMRRSCSPFEGKSNIVLGRTYSCVSSLNWRSNLVSACVL